jgi:hypothetical protein
MNILSDMETNVGDVAPKKIWSFIIATETKKYLTRFGHLAYGELRQN